jgi:DNA-binding CsgD family transcriptional regulator
VGCGSSCIVRPVTVRLAQPHPAEQAVARLVADGLSNPQIGHRLYISRRTVQTHLGHIFIKLDITSRAQLAAQFARQRD